MDPFRGQGGIQMLLTAEQDAQQVISNARNSKPNHFFRNNKIKSTHFVNDLTYIFIGVEIIHCSENGEIETG